MAGLLLTPPSTLRPVACRHAAAWLPLLPLSAAAPLQPLLACPPPGFDSQHALLSVHVEELLLPAGEDPLLQRPRTAHYSAAYRLPGDSVRGCCHPQLSTCSCCASGLQQQCVETHASHTAHRSAGSQGETCTAAKAPSSGSSASGGQAGVALLAQRGWHVAWRHCSRHWVVADWRLAAALLAYPLSVAVSKREPSGSSRRSSSSSGDEGVLLPLGSVEIDMAPLLLPRPGGASRPSCR